MLLFALLFAASVAGEDVRPVGVDITSDVRLIDLQTCVSRLMAKSGNVTSNPIENGVALDFNTRTLLAPPGSPPLIIEIRDLGATRTMTAAYRHPWSQKVAAGLLSDAGKKCAGAPHE